MFSIWSHCNHQKNILLSVLSAGGTDFLSLSQSKRQTFWSSPDLVISRIVQTLTIEQGKERQ